MKKIYQVTTEGDCEGRSTRTLGFASGEQNDIMRYFDDQKYYDIRLHEITIIDVTKDSVVEKKKLIDRKKELEEELSRIKKRLG